MQELQAEYRQQIKSMAKEKGVCYENMTIFTTGLQ